MCDYSLMALPNRLAVGGEELVTHRFQTGTIGLVSSSDGRLFDSGNKPRGLVERIRRLLNPPQFRRCTAVCIPPGTRLMLRDISQPLQQELQLQCDTQDVVFTQTGAGIGFRDAIRFDNGREVSLQRLHEGQRLRVLSLSSAEDITPELENYLVGR
jgi:hypothetical protein